MPNISVIVPCYNQAHFLPDTLNSVLEQTYHDWECIIVNDGSPDNTENVALDWCIKDSRFKYIKKENGGLSSARNVGLNLAKGNWIQFLDSDDVILPLKFERQITLLKNSNGIGLCYCDYTRGTIEDIYKAPTPPGPYLPLPNVSTFLEQMASDWETRVSIPPHCFLFDARIFEERKIRFDTGLANHEDWECWMQIALLNVNIFSVNDNLAIYRYNTGSMSYNFRPMRDGFLKAIDKLIRQNKSNEALCILLKNKRKETSNSYKGLIVNESKAYRTWLKVRYVISKIIPNSLLKLIKQNFYS
ncbi:MAG: glycosyltransferase family 2 protein [Mariniphaga sp.]